MWTTFSWQHTPTTKLTNLNNSKKIQLNFISKLNLNFL